MNDTTRPDGVTSTTDEPDILAEIQAEVAADLEQERAPRGGRWMQYAGALFTVVLGVTTMVMAYGFGMGRPAQPGPGLWPFVIGVLLTVLGVLLLLAAHGLDDAEAFTRSSLLPVAGLATFFMLAILMPMIGFEIPSLLLCLIWLRFLGGESWRSSVVTAVAIVVAFYLIFVVALSIPLPRLI